MIAKAIKTNCYSSDFGLNEKRIDIRFKVKGSIKSVEGIIKAIGDGETVINTIIVPSKKLHKAIEAIGITDIRRGGDWVLYKDDDPADCIKTDEIYEKSDVDDLFEQLGPEITISIDFAGTEAETYFNGFTEVYEARVYIDPSESLEDFYEVEITPNAFSYYCNGDDE